MEARRFPSVPVCGTPGSDAPAAMCSGISPAQSADASCFVPDHPHFPEPGTCHVHIPSSSQTCPDSAGGLSTSCLTQRQRALLTLPANLFALLNARPDLVDALLARISQRLSLLFPQGSAVVVPARPEPVAKPGSHVNHIRRPGPPGWGWRGPWSFSAPKADAERCFIEWRWPDGVCCPECFSVNVASRMLRKPQLNGDLRKIRRLETPLNFSLVQLCG